MARYIPDGEESVVPSEEESLCDNSVHRIVKPSHIVWGAGISIVVAVAIVITCIVIYTNTGGTVPFDHGIIIDAGSTHIQALLYKWVGSKENGTGEVTQQAECTCESDVISLSDPATVVDCVENITTLISKSEKPSLPLYFGATAGMRLMNLTQPDIVQLMLLNIKCGLQKLGVNVREVNVISGFEEGIYSWITVNFLKKTLHPKVELHDIQHEGQFEETYGSLDMGGASTQVSFAVNPESSDNSSITHLKLYGHNFSIFSTSYICFGAVEAYNRYHALLIKDLNATEDIDDPCLPEGNITVINAKKLLGGPCVTTDAFEEWLQFKSNRLKNFTFKGSSNYKECEHHVEYLIDSAKCKERGFKKCAEKLVIPNQNMKKFMAFSSFYYVTDFLNATNASLTEFKNITMNWCSLSWQDILHHSFSHKIFKHLTQYCFGAIFIAKWLTNVYGFDETLWNNISFQDKVVDTDLGWALGMMINATNAIPAEKPSQPFLSDVVLVVIVLCCGFVLLLGILLIRNHVKERWMKRQRLRLIDD